MEKDGEQFGGCVVLWI